MLMINCLFILTAASRDFVCNNTCLLLNIKYQQTRRSTLVRLKIGTSLTRALANFYIVLIFLRFFLFELRAHAGLTDRQTDGQTDGQDS